MHVFSSDVTSDADCTALRESVRQITGGELNVLINNALVPFPLVTELADPSGEYVSFLAEHHHQVLIWIGYTMTAVDTDISQVEKMFAVNVFGPMRMVRVFHKMIVACEGTIVNVGSIGGVTPYIYGGEHLAPLAGSTHACSIKHRTMPAKLH